jgi:uncharacterized protein involved in exopolysaccharide biosynthesis
MTEPPSHPGAPLDWSAYGHSLFKGRWIVLASLLGAIALGAAITLLAPRAYTAETTIEIDREPQRVAPVGSGAPVDTVFSSDEFAQTEYGLLRGHALAIRVNETLGLDRDGRFIDEMRGRRVGEGPATGAVDRASPVVTLLRENVRIAPQRGSRLVAIRFTSPDPMLSAKIANAFAAGLRDMELERRLQASDYARDFLQRHLVDAKSKLELSERGLADYAATQGIITLPGADVTGGAASGRSLTADNLEAFNTALAGARTDRILAEQRWRAANAAGPAAPEVLADPTVQQISQDRARLAEDYQDRLSVFKPDYPDMRRLRARMDETDRQLARKTGAILASLRARFAAALGDERILTAQVAALETALVDLRARSIRYTILQREVDTNRILYDGLLQRFRDVGVAGGVVADNITIIDPATPPDHPSSPRPLLVLLLAATAGLAAGMGGALARDGRRY